VDACRGAQGRKSMGFMNKFLEIRGVAAIVGCLLATAVSWSVLVGVAGATTLTAPTISGTAREGQTLTSNASTPGPAGDTFTITDQWLVCTTPTTCTNGPTGASFPLTSAEVGKTIEVQESANDTSTTATPPNPAIATSAATAAVLPLPPANTTAPSISGVVQEGQILTANPGVWSGTPTGYAYAWTSGGTPVGTNSATYTVAATDVGKAIVVSVIASNAGGGSLAVASAPTAAALPLPPVNTVSPAISGTAQQGQVLTLTPGVWINSPTSFTEQWWGCAGLICTAIPGQTGTSYTVGPGDVGHTIDVVETAFNAAAPLGVAATSGPTGTASTTSTTSVVAFSQNAPTTNQTVTLVATVSSNSGNANPRGSLSFFNGSGTIAGCAGKGVNGRQTITIVCQASFPAGVAQISAAYVADPGSLVAGSNSDTTPISVSKGATSVSLAVTPTVAPGGRATYIATVAVPVGNAGPNLPTGSIEFLDGGQPIAACASQALSSLTATCSVSYPSAGTHDISAFYEGNANFTGATSPASGVQIVNGAPKAPAVQGALGSTLGWRIYYHPQYSELTALEAFAVPKGASILVQCYGKGCPFAKWRLAKAADSISLLSSFRHRRLRAGTRITVRMTRRHWVGKYYSFRIRAGRPPMVRTACLAPGGVKPGVGCSIHST
jgi:hypothetical protein